MKKDMTETTEKEEKKGKRSWLRRLKYKKYFVVLVLGVFIVGFLGNNSLMGHLRNKKRIDELKEEIAFNRALTEKNQQQVHLLQTDPRAVERVGRERYFMKQADEDVFMLSDDTVTENNFSVDETFE